MNSFHSYTDNALYTNCSPEGIMLNGHTVFLTACKRDNMKDQRMHWIVNNFTNYENVDKRPYYEYYKSYISDVYNEYEVLDKKHLDTVIEDTPYEDDIDIHYRELANKHAALAKLNERICSCNEMPEDTELFEYQESTDEISEYQSSVDYDEYYLDTDYDNDAYYEKCLDNEEYEDDDFDY